MNSKQPIGTYRHKKIVLLGGLFLLGLCAAASGLRLAMSSYLPQHTGFIVLEGLPENTLIDAFLETPGKKIESLLPQEENTALNRALPQQEVMLPPSYRVNTSLKMPWGGYRDLVLDVGKNGETFGVLADGFSPYDEITMTLDDKTVYKNIPMDWSGRITLKANISPEKRILACVRINGREQSIGLCHKVGTGDRA